MDGEVGRWQGKGEVEEGRGGEGGRGEWKEEEGKGREANS